MMNDTKEIKAFYEAILVKRIEEALDHIKTNGFDERAYTKISLLADDLNKANAADSFFNAHHEEGRQHQEARQRTA